MKILQAFHRRKRLGINFPEKGRTKQQFRDDCDINIIWRRFLKTGQEPGVKENGVYSDVTGQTLLESMQIVAESKTMFEELPSRIRYEFDNDPVKFLEFVENPQNSEAMIEMGLAKRITQDQEPPKKSAKPLNTKEPPAGEVSPVGSGSADAPAAT